jgi:hypothetical protein
VPGVDPYYFLIFAAGDPKVWKDASSEKIQTEAALIPACWCAG